MSNFSSNPNNSNLMNTSNPPLGTSAIPGNTTTSANIPNSGNSSTVNKINDLTGYGSSSTAGTGLGGGSYAGTSTGLLPNSTLDSSSGMHSGIGSNTNTTSGMGGYSSGLGHSSDINSGLGHSSGINPSSTTGGLGHSSGISSGNTSGLGHSSGLTSGNTSGLGHSSGLTSGNTSGLGHSSGLTSGNTSGLSSNQTGLNSGLSSNQTGLNSGLGSSTTGMHSGVNTGSSGLSSQPSSGIHNTSTTTSHPHATTAAAGAAGAALGAGAASHHDHERHNHPHHHEHTGHHVHGQHSGTGTSTVGNYDPNTQTGNTGMGGALHKAGIGHDPTVNTTGPSTLGTAATAGALGAGAGAAAGGLHDSKHHGVGTTTTGHHGLGTTTTGHHGVGTTTTGHHGIGNAPGQGTGLASGFAVNTASTAAINPATGAPDYQAVQHANIHDNIPNRGVGATSGIAAGAAGAATAATASKMMTASGLPKRVLMVLTSSSMEMPDGKNTGYHWSEVFYPYEVFKKHGYDVDLTSLTGSAQPDYHSVNWVEQLTGMELSAMNAWRSKSHALHKELGNLRTPQQLQASNYGIIYFTGGHGTLEDFPTADAYQRMAAEIYERNGIVCAVCHGVCCLANVRLNNGTQLLQGKQVTGFSEEGEKQMKVLDFLHKRNFPLISDFVSRAGGIYQAPNKPFDEFVLDSDRIITGPNPASAGPVAERAVRILEGR